MDSWNYRSLGYWVVRVMIFHALFNVLFIMYTLCIYPNEMSRHEL